MTEELIIRATKTDNVNAVNKKQELDVDVHHTSRVLPNSRFSTTIDAYEVYLKEVKACNKYRIITTLHPYCTNVLFNVCTEVNENEGGVDSTSFLDSNYHSFTVDDAMMGKSNNLTRYDVVNSTECSKLDRISYHPGLDIFNNHMLRNMTFRKINKYSEPVNAGTKENFDTHLDLLRDFQFNNVKYYPRLGKITGSAHSKDMPMYDATTFMSFNDGMAIQQNLTHENGWYGFYNNNTPRLEKDYITNAERVINNESQCKFIDMYPDRTLFSFNPKYNKKRNRLEYNWGIFLTYPYASTTNHPIVRNIGRRDDNGDILYDCDGNTEGLLIYSVEKVMSGSGNMVVMMRTLPRHNLAAHSNIYIYYSIDGGITYSRSEKPYRVANVGNLRQKYRENYFYLADTSILDEVFDGHILDFFYTRLTSVPYTYVSTEEDSEHVYTELPEVPTIVNENSPDYIKVGSGTLETVCSYDYYERKYTYNEYMATGTYSYVQIAENDIQTFVNWTPLNSFPSGHVPRNPDAGSPRYVRVNTGSSQRRVYFFYKKDIDCDTYDGVPMSIPETGGRNISVTIYEEIPTSPVTTWTDDGTFDNIPSHPISYPDYIRVRQSTYNYYAYDSTNGVYVAESESEVPSDWEWTDSNTFDDIPSDKRIQHIRVYTYRYYAKRTQYYAVITTYTDMPTKNPDTDIIGAQIRYLLKHVASLRFRKFLNGYESSYYIRKFRKIPNWKYSRQELTGSVADNMDSMEYFIDANARDENGRMYDFDRELQPLAFSQTLYSDSVSQAVFTDSVDIEYLKDNIGRPLTEIFTTVIRNNKGYVDWYKNQIFSDYTDENDVLHKIEYSHCFGRLSYGFDYAVFQEDTNKTSDRGWLSDISRIRFAYDDGLSPIDCRTLEQWERYEDDDRGIYEEPSIDDEVFFGDLVEFIPSRCEEAVLQKAQIRFNTAQREIGEDDDYRFMFDDIADTPETASDDVNWIQGKVFGGSVYRKEGYYYSPHFSMAVRELAPVVRQASHRTVNVVSVEPLQMNGMFIKITDTIPNAATIGRKVFICDDEKNYWYDSRVAGVIDKYNYYINIIPRDVSNNGGLPYISWIDIVRRIEDGTMKIRVENVDIPSYATQVGVNAFLWRDILHVGDVNTNTLPDYPFSNNNLYINQDVRLYLRRQDPFGWSGLRYTDTFGDTEGRVWDNSVNEYIPEEETVC